MLVMREVIVMMVMMVMMVMAQYGDDKDIRMGENDRLMLLPKITENGSQLVRPVANQDVHLKAIVTMAVMMTRMTRMMMIVVVMMG